MPIYEFYSPDTNKIYTFLARSLSQRDRIPRCPEGEGFRMERRVSGFSITGRHKEERGDDPLAGIDETQMESLMSEMEAEMEGMDDHHPDPKQLGRMMRKLANLMGDKTPETLREIVMKLEEGTDPESLEDKLGDMPDIHDPDAEIPDETDMLWDTVKKKLALMRGPRRDPKLYEMNDWL
jgi:hypothetical protein